MQKKSYLFILGSFLYTTTQGEPPYNERIQKRIDRGEICVKSRVQNIKPKRQKLDFYLVGLHHLSCNRILPKLSHYENYHKYIGFIKKSSYDDTKKRVYFSLHSSLLPFKMVLDFKLPRIRKIGSYPYSFDKGFLKGLKGNIRISEKKKKCLIQSDAKWNGPHSGINPTLFEFFSLALAKSAMHTLFRISRIP